jgi:pimeloyl-ACP methyl ester carboxylesterase
VDDFIDENGLENPVFCGHSMGGAIALTLALDFDRFGDLILVGAGAKLGVLPDILTDLSDSPLAAIEKMLTPRSFYKIDLEMGRLARRTLSLQNPGVFLNDYKACNGFDVRDKLSRITAKTLIVCGESDRMTPPKYSHYLNANIANSTAFFFREAGHMVPLEKPEALGGLLQTFLSSLSP